MSRKFIVNFSMSYCEEVVLEDGEIEGMSEDEIEDYALDEAINQTGGFDGEVEYGSVEITEA